MTTGNGRDWPTGNIHPLLWGRGCLLFHPADCLSLGGCRTCVPSPCNFSEVTRNSDLSILATIRFFFCFFVFVSLGRPELVFGPAANLLFLLTRTMTLLSCPRYSEGNSHQLLFFFLSSFISSVVCHLFFSLFVSITFPPSQKSRESFQLILLYLVRL